MDRTIVYPGSIPLDSDILWANRNSMVAIGALMRATLGTGAIADGLACTPTVPPSMSIAIGPGSITSFANVDSTAYGSLDADSADPLLKMGINLGATSFTLAAPGVTGQAINYLMEASFQEADGAPVVLPYFNAANPALPYSGPGNTGVAQNTQRLQRVQLQAVQGAPAVAGTQVTPSPDAGFVGLFVITVNYGQTFIGSGSIAPFAGAPFVQHKLPALSPGYSNMSTITASTSFTPPQGVNRVKLRLVGGGGAGGAGGGGAGGGGAGGGAVEGFYGVIPGVPITCSVGAGGTGGGGGATSFGALASASGGSGGGAGASLAGGAGGAGGSGSGVGILAPGSQGQGGLATTALLIGGGGGGTILGGGAAATLAAPGTNLAGSGGLLPGSGGAGGTGSAGGGAGAAGIIVVEW